MDALLVIANAGAGSQERDDLGVALEVLRAETEVEVVRTGSPDDLDEVLPDVGERTIVVAGGDGSLHAVVAALHRRGELGDRPIGLLPFGTGNDFARTLGVPLRPEAAAAALVGGHLRAMDLLLDDRDRVVVNSVHLGASAQASRRADRWKKRLGTVGLGILGYPIGAALAATRPPYVRLRVEVDDRVLVDDEPVLMLAIGNGTSVGGGTELTPEADPTDARLDVMVSRSIGPLERFAFVADLVRGRHETRGEVTAVQARSVTVTGEKFYLAADGEIDGPVRRRSWHVRPAAYRIVVPG